MEPRRHSLLGCPLVPSRRLCADRPLARARVCSSGLRLWGVYGTVAPLVGSTLVGVVCDGLPSLASIVLAPARLDDASLQPTFASSRGTRLLAALRHRSWHPHSRVRLARTRAIVCASPQKSVFQITDRPVVLSPPFQVCARGANLRTQRVRRRSCPIDAAGPPRAGLAIPGRSSPRGGRECAWPDLACGASTHARQSIVVG